MHAHQSWQKNTVTERTRNARMTQTQLLKRDAAAQVDLELNEDRKLRKRQRREA